MNLYPDYAYIDGPWWSYLIGLTIFAYVVCRVKKTGEAVMSLFEQIPEALKGKSIMEVILKPSGKQCPLCGQEFNKNGYGFGGLDAHWRSKHEDFIPYDKARLIILDKPRSRD